MKFRKFGKTLLLGALSAGLILSVTSCVQSYTVGFLYVTGTVTSGSIGNGYVAGFKIDHNTGKLNPINGLKPPVASGGSNPVRALLLVSSRFLYVLNQGEPQSGQTECTTEYPCENPNITVFSVGANGVLTAQETFTTQGKNPFRMVADGSGTYLYILDHDSPDNYLPAGTPAISNGCAQALNGASTCGDITAFLINQTTGRLSLVENAQVKITTAANGSQNLTYFPVPANPIDFVLSGASFLTLYGTPADGDLVFPYNYTTGTGQLTLGSNSSISIGEVYNATAIVTAGGYIWVLDNDPITYTPAGSTTPVTAPSQILPWSVTSNGQTGVTLTIETSGPIADDPNQSNPIYLVEENKGKWFYVANQGVPSPSTLALSGVAGYVINTPFRPTELGGTPIGFGTGSGPVCLVEDPSNQFFYEANSYDQNVTGQQLDENAGVLTPLSQSSKVPSTYALSGPPTWCLVDGRISN
jgi:6-phosphogluconolactonase (cycloisomerase 2 family)